MGEPGNLFLTGASGSIGRQMAIAALAEGWAVRGLVLPEEDARPLEQAGAQVCRGRIEEPASLDAASEGTTHAVHCAALLPHLSHLGKEAFQRVNVDGPVSMVRLAARRRWRRVVLLSTCGVLGREKDGATTDETAYRKPFDLYTWSKIEAEKAVVRECARLGVPGVVLRPANVYGAGMAFKWPELFSLVQAGKMKVIGDGRARFCVVHVRDLVRAIRAALDEDRAIAPGERILISSGEQLSFGQVVSLVAQKLDAPPAGSVPYPLALTAAFLASALPSRLRAGRLKFLHPEVVREYRTGFRFDTAHAERVLGFRACESFAQGIEEAISAWKRRAA